mmetsp:Transcript_15727/g.31293  ORF Transcript_15727/g.31293 Transcript_15727/m.31293 type:complete len:201 (-) Transcript_15727:40-642(-)
MTTNSFSRFNIIAARNIVNNIIGMNGGIPWRIPEDRTYFKDVTREGFLLMGRATWLESKIHLPHARTTAVLTNNEIFRQSLKSMPNVVTVGSLDEGLEVADEAVRRDEIRADNVWVVGGEKVYEEALVHPRANTLHLTDIDFEDASSAPSWSDVGHVARFPGEALWSDRFKLTTKIEGELSGKDGLPRYTFSTFEAIVHS